MISLSLYIIEDMKNGVFKTFLVVFFVFGCQKETPGNIQRILNLSPEDQYRRSVAIKWRGLSDDKSQVDISSYCSTLGFTAKHCAENSQILEFERQKNFFFWFLDRVGENDVLNPPLNRDSRFIFIGAEEFMVLEEPIVIVKYNINSFRGQYPILSPYPIPQFFSKDSNEISGLLTVYFSSKAKVMGKVIGWKFYDDIHEYEQNEVFYERDKEFIEEIFSL